jgi:hypothetical protein
MQLYCRLTLFVKNIYYGYIIYTGLSAELFSCDVKILSDMVTKYYLET